ncbi:MAG: Clp protease N-terminal domain-containing protein [Acidimicrobiales bacterium]
MSSLAPTPRTKRLLEKAEEAARHLGHGYLGTEHIFLAMLDDIGGVAHAVMEQRGVIAELRADLLSTLQDPLYSRPAMTAINRHTGETVRGPDGTSTTG